MFKRVLPLMFIWVFMAGASSAEEPGPIAKALDSVSFQQNGNTDKPAGFQEWQYQLDSAKSDRRRARNLILLGIGAGVVGTVVATTAAEADVIDCAFGNDCGRGAGWTLGWITALAGYGVSAYGGWQYVSAKDRIDDLDREGRTKGFLSWAPGSKAGVQVGVRVTF